jgi:hypothetical protein
MKLFAYINPDGSIEALVTAPDGEHFSALAPDPGVQVCEIQNHGLKGESVELDELRSFLESYTVAMTPASGKLVRRKK